MTLRHLALYLVVAALALGGLFVGAADLGAGEVWDGVFGGGDALSEGVIRGIRIPRILGGIGLGVAAGIGGIGVQAAFRSRLAEPYLLGVSSGAGLGLVVGALLDAGGIPILPVALATGAGVFCALSIRQIGHFTTSSDGLILAGVALNFVFLAWTLIVTFAVDSPRLPTFVYFVFGSLGTVTWSTLWWAGPLILASYLVLRIKARDLDLLTLGTDEATGLGVDVPRLVTLVLVAAGVATGASVAIAGVVGFVGLTASLLGRRLFGPRHRTLVPAVAALGAAFVLASDTLIRGSFGQVEVPLGVITAAVGGPALVAMLLRTKVAA